MKLNTLSSIKLLALSACIGILSPGVVWGQATNSAEVTGSVTDPSGAVIPQVSVIVKDLDKNVERTITTNDSGVYDTGPMVPADHYTLTFRKDGFTSVERGPMTLNSGVIGMNVRLTVGQSAQTVAVQDTAAPLLTTTTAEISSTITSETLTDLPQAGESRIGSHFLPFCREREATAATITARIWEACRSTEPCRLPTR